jgi:hypothetical protein
MTRSSSPPARYLPKWLHIDLPDRIRHAEAGIRITHINAPS